MKYRVGFILLVVGSLILYLSLRPSPSLREVSWLPGWLGAWADQHGDLRTGVPFFVLSSYFALEAWWTFRSFKYLPYVLWILGASGLLVLLGLAEVIQVWLPQRTASFGDIAWGSVGTIAGGWPLLFRRVWPRKARSHVKVPLLPTAGSKARGSSA